MRFSEFFIKICRICLYIVLQNREQSFPSLRQVRLLNRTADQSALYVNITCIYRMYSQSLTKVLVIWLSFGPAQYKLLPVRIFFWWTELFLQFHTFHAYIQWINYVLSLFQFPKYRIIINQSNHWHKIIDPTNILNTLDLEARNINLVLEKNCVGHSDRQSVNFCRSS